MKVLKQIALFCIAFLLTMGLSELFIRTSHLASVSYTEFYDDIGRGRRKNLDYLYFNEGFGIGRYNKYRYIGEANPPEKPENVFRVALMGDSYVEAWQVFDRDYFGNIAEKILEEKYPNLHFEFLNFGRSGFDIADMYAYQKNFVESFHPDLILYFLEKPALQPVYSDPLRPSTIIENDSLIISFDFDSTDLKIYQTTNILTQNSSIMNMLNISRKRAIETSVTKILFDKIYFLFNSIEPEPEISDIIIEPVTEKIVKSLDPANIIIVNRDKHALPEEFHS
ncbi:MAG TPA: hypothetical protein VIN10_15550, partial [Bacteroidales bacterium]